MTEEQFEEARNILVKIAEIKKLLMRFESDHKIKRTLRVSYEEYDKSIYDIVSTKLENIQQELIPVLVDFLKVELAKLELELKIL